MPARSFAVVETEDGGSFVLVIDFAFSLKISQESPKPNNLQSVNI
jgi:hypothetical protein